VNRLTSAAASAAPQKGDEQWEIQLGPVESKSLDKHDWSVEIFDGASCQTITSLTSTNGEAKKVKVSARHGSTDVRWEVSGDGKK
jgi:hypothetical protein